MSELKEVPINIEASKMRSHVGIIGAGSWGTALGVICNRAGSEVTLWTRNEQVEDVIRRTRYNEIYLPDVFIEPAINVSMDLDELTSKSDILVIATPSQSIRTLCITLSDMVESHIPLVITTKGIERGSLLLMHEVIASILPLNPLAILSGPNFAKEAAQGLPTATTLACRNVELAERLAFTIGGKLFRPYVTDDVIGTEIGGAVKNVIAIACGIAEGKGYGENARAALITRGLAEMTRLAMVKGGKLETLMGLSGVGDLFLTCSSRQSRNMSLGYALGQGKSLDDVLPGKVHGTTEGVQTADSLFELAHKQGVNMPISKAVHNILKGNLTVDEGINQLLSRPFTKEMVKEV